MRLPFRWGLGLAVAMVIVTSSAAQTPGLPDGNWYVGYRPTLTTPEFRLALIQTSTKDGKTTTKILDGGRAEWSVANLKVEGKNISFDLAGPAKLSFEGILDGKDTIRGSIGEPGRYFAAKLTKTDAEKIEMNQMSVPAVLGDAMKEYSKARAEVTVLQSKLRTERDADKRKEIQAELKTKTEAFEKEAPKMLSKALESEKDEITQFYVGLELIAAAGKAKLSVADVEKAMATSLKVAGSFGSRLEDDASLKIAESLSTQEGLSALALPLIEKGLKANPAADLKLKLTKAKVSALEKSGKKEEASKLLVQLETIELEADKEYKKKVPNFTPAKFAGRKDPKANKVAVLELFTGAQCPPCVAADVAFDALGSAYSPKDLVLLQYHMHIPGPDPLTNPDSIARWDYYREKFENGVRGTPTTLFNGKVKAGGGGGMANAEKKYEQYNTEILEILEQTSPYTLSGQATLNGDQLTATIKVEAKEKPDADQLLRVLLVEEEVRYVGGNQLRLHHHVVRSQFNKKNGVPVKELAEGKLQVTLSLDELKKDLQRYLDEYAAQRPFPNPDRPMNLKNLKVIALVQDDLTAEIFQAVEIEIHSPTK